METHNAASLAERTPVSAPVRPDSAWRVVSAAVQGVSHVRQDLPCQDAAGYQVRADGVLVIALADGAGSARFSELGAVFAVEEALRVLSDAPDRFAEEERWEELLREVFSAARQAVMQLAENPESGEPASPREYACTLTCAIAMGDRLAVGQVGDGAAVAVDANGDLFALTRLQRGEYANETHFLVEEDALDHLVIEVTDRPVKALAVMSDGLIRLALKMPSQEPHAPFFQPLFRFVESVEDGVSADQQLAGFLNSERVNARTDDDKSLVLAVRTGPVEVRTLSAEPVQTDKMEEPSAQVEVADSSLNREGE